MYPWQSRRSEITGFSGFIPRIRPPAPTPAVPPPTHLRRSAAAASTRPIERTAPDGAAEDGARPYGT
jgi:hypothetical protein